MQAIQKGMWTFVWTYRDRQGLVMGTAQSFSSGLRAFGPVVSGFKVSRLF